MDPKKRKFKAAFNVDQDDSRSISSALERASCVSTKSIKDAMRERGATSIIKSDLKRLKTAVFQQRASLVDQARRMDLEHRKRAATTSTVEQGVRHADVNGADKANRQNKKRTKGSSMQVNGSIDDSDTMAWISGIRQRRLASSDEDDQLMSTAQGDDRGSAKPSKAQKRRQKRAANRAAELDAMHGALDTAKTQSIDMLQQRAVDMILSKVQSS